MKATFAAGCFWGVEYKFSKLPGVTATKVGYIGGAINKPTYDQVCDGDTGHAEVVQLEFDSAKISFQTLLEFFFKIHNPTTLNRQGPDVGTQYRSAVFYHDAEQKSQAEDYIQKLNQQIEAGKHEQWKNPVVTRLEVAKTFWPAEEYHQKYVEKNGDVCGI